MFLVGGLFSDSSNSQGMFCDCSAYPISLPTTNHSSLNTHSVGSSFQGDPDWTIGMVIGYAQTKYQYVGNTTGIFVTGPAHVHINTCSGTNIENLN